jgi:hypothetical protein
VIESVPEGDIFMTPQELSDAINAATTEEFGPGPWDTEKFPMAYFNYGVFTIAPNGQTTQRAPKYCATALGASQIASLFVGQPGPIQFNGIVLAEAMVFTGLVAGWSDNQLVPWLEFVQGTGKKMTTGHVNAGVLLDYFNHGLPAATAMNNVVAEVKALTFA